MLCAAMAMLGGSVSQAAKQPSSAMTELRITILAPPCTLTVPPQVSLGKMDTGVHRTSFEISIDCPIPVRTALTAQARTGILQQGSDTLAMVGTGSALLSIKDVSNTKIKLDSSANFCDSVLATDLRKTCRLSAETVVTNADARGQVEAVIAVTVRYPA